MSLASNHPLHAAGIGLAAGALAKASGLDTTTAIVAGAGTGGATYLYMSQYGHTFPPGAKAVASTYMPSGQSTAAVEPVRQSQAVSPVRPLGPAKSASISDLHLSPRGRRSADALANFFARNSASHASKPPPSSHHSKPPPSSHHSSPLGAIGQVALAPMAMAGSLGGGVIHGISSVFGGFF